MSCNNCNNKLDHTMPIKVGQVSKLKSNPGMYQSFSRPQDNKITDVQKHEKFSSSFSKTKLHNEKIEQFFKASSQACHPWTISI